MQKEQSGLPGQIQVTQEVVTSAGSDFTFELRGTLTIKGKAHLLRGVDGNYLNCIS